MRDSLARFFWPLPHATRIDLVAGRMQHGEGIGDDAEEAGEEMKTPSIEPFLSNEAGNKPVARLIPVFHKREIAHRCTSSVPLSDRDPLRREGPLHGLRRQHRQPQNPISSYRFGATSGARGRRELSDRGAFPLERHFYAEGYPKCGPAPWTRLARRLPGPERRQSCCTEGEHHASDGPGDEALRGRLPGLSPRVPDHAISSIASMSAASTSSHGTRGSCWPAPRSAARALSSWARDRVPQAHLCCLRGGVRRVRERLRGVRRHAGMRGSLPPLRRSRRCTAA